MVPAKGEPLVPELHRAVGAAGIEARSVADPLSTFNVALQVDIPPLTAVVERRA